MTTNSLVPLNPALDMSSHIIGSIYVSSYPGAASFKGRRICVHHDTSLVYDFHMPILLTRPDDEDRNKGAIANLKQLELIGTIIDSCLDDNDPLMIHCKGGVERSPLTLVYYLMKFRKYSIDEAYEYVKKKRPVVVDRRSWLPEEFLQSAIHKTAG